MVKACLLLADGFEEVEAITPIDFLRRAGIEVTVIGVSGTTVTGSRQLKVVSDAKAADIDPETYDAVIVPGGMPGAEHIHASGTANGIIRHMMQAGKLVAAICAAPAVVLEPLGILSGKRVTCYPGFEEKLGQAIFSEERVVQDDNLITSRGPGTAAEFSLAIIAYLMSREKADEIHRGTLQKP